ncbi:MAG: low affinity potassium transporter [Caeruleum heppii]|nr:MAG: low affinity potassium transporter [Caeruleum heppii]
MPYIDALFFASGASTQSGLNSIDVNLISTYQQIIIYLIPMIANPIFIHSFVVFVRLYWFEKRFENIVQESRNYRRSRSRNKTQTVDDRDLNRVEKGVEGRSITVLHPETRATGNSYMPGIEEERPAADDPLVKTLAKSSQGSTSESGGTLDDAASGSGVLRQSTSPTALRDITFADEKSPSADPESDTRVPGQRPTEHHIAFLENQRNPRDKGTLRIPGPRDFDRGDMPQTLVAEQEEDGGILDGKATNVTASSNEARPSRDDFQHRGDTADGNDDDQPVRRNITIDEPDHPAARTKTNSFSLRFRSARPLGRVGPSTPGSANFPAQLRARTGTFSSFRSTQSARDPIPYLSWTPTIGRNSAFIDLTEEQREELGGIEYRALKTLAIILVGYFVGFHLLGVVCLFPWIKRSGTYSSIVREVGQSPSWWGIFTPASLFNDLGYTITPDSMISFQKAVFPLLLGSFLIIIGNTGFPCMLRFIIWSLSKVVPYGSGIWEELRFLLDHPRRCFTLLFPSKATWWLFWILVILNSVDLLLFVILDLNDNTVISLSPGIRVLDGWFQATATRTAGFSVVNLADLHPAVQVSYLIMMYISVFPIAISVRRTNVYEEKSLGIYSNKEEQDADEKEPSYVGAHLRRQLSFDLWYVFLGLFLIAIVEGHRIENTNDYAFTTFSVLFEIVSAYGTVGLSLGYPGANASFSSQFSVISKLVIIAMMIRGRHRGLPYQLDRAILLPSESLHHREDQLLRKRGQRRDSNVREGAEGLTRPQTAEGGEGPAAARESDANKRDG